MIIYRLENLLAQFFLQIMSSVCFDFYGRRLHSDVHRNIKQSVLDFYSFSHYQLYKSTFQKGDRQNQYSCIFMRILLLTLRPIYYEMGLILYTVVSQVLILYKTLNQALCMREIREVLSSKSSLLVREENASNYNNNVIYAVIETCTGCYRNSAKENIVSWLPATNSG